MSLTPRTDREVYKASERDIGFEVINPSLTRILERRVAALEGALRLLVTEWEALPGNRRYSPAKAQDWLVSHMSPAINNARDLLSESSALPSPPYIVTVARKALERAKEDGDESVSLTVDNFQRLLGACEVHRAGTVEETKAGACESCGGSGMKSLRAPGRVSVWSCSVCGGTGMGPNVHREGGGT